MLQVLKTLNCLIGYEIDHFLNKIFQFVKNK